MIELSPGLEIYGLKLLKRIKILGKTRNYYGWEVQLSSGKTRIIKEQKIQNLKPSHKYNGRRHPSIWLYFRYKYGAQSRGYQFDLNFGQFNGLIRANCDYCNDPGSNCHEGFQYNGLDRKDNEGGYTLDNVVPCCRECNRIKSDLLTYEETKAAVRAILTVRNKS